MGGELRDPRTSSQAINFRLDRDSERPTDDQLALQRVVRDSKAMPGEAWAQFVERLRSRLRRLGMAYEDMLGDGFYDQPAEHEPRP
jgi:hypothetical protein